MQLRRAERRDRELIVEMARLACGFEDRPLPSADDPEVLALVPGRADVAVVATQQDGEGLGAVWWHFHEPPLITDSQGRAVPELAMAVREDARANGIGARLLEQLAMEAAKEGLDALALNVHLRSPATRLYMRCGFRVAGKGRGWFGVAMVREFGQICSDSPMMMPSGPRRKQSR
jgi:GNAT superfamily N-acetyltransferase